MTQAITNIVVVGGGTAGWLAAALIASYHQKPDGPALSITLIESADIPTIGVGEGTWPTMKNTLQQIGLSEKDFFRSCHAAFKQGGKFVNWCEGTGDFYYHPFTVPLGYGRLDVAPYLRTSAIMPASPICSMNYAKPAKRHARSAKVSIRAH